jgi:non-heme chloroperoxidase
VPGTPDCRRVLAEAPEVTHQEKSVELPNGIRLPYVEQGDPSGTALVLLHAVADSWHTFERVLPHLPASIHAFAVTQRGHGDASRPLAGYGSQDFAADLAALMGAPLSLGDKPAVRKMFDSSIATLTDPIDPTFVREFAESTLAQPVPQAFLDTIVAENLKVPARVWKVVCEGLLEDDSAHELDRITAPTLIVWGDQDTILDRSEQEAMAAAIPDSRLVVYPGAGHSIYWEEPDRIAFDLASFVQTIV